MDNDKRREALEAASIEAGNAGIKTLLLLNGSACIAILGFLANVFAEDMDSDRATFFQAAIRSLVWFATGAGLSVVVSLFAYLANQAYAIALTPTFDHDRNWRRGELWNNAAIALAVASLCMFFAGVFTIWRTL